MKTVSASEFKATCLELLRNVEESGEPIVITKHGRPIAEVRAPQAERARSPFGCMMGRTKLQGDVLSPAVSADAWDVLKR